METRKPPVLPVIALFVLTLFVFIPGTIYLTNAVEFTNSVFDLLLVGAGLALVAGLVLWLALRALRAIGQPLQEKGISLLFALAFLLWLQGNFLLWNYGPLDGRTIPWPALKWRGFIDGAVWIAVLAAALAFSPRILRAARKACLGLLLLQLGYGAALLLRQPETPSFQKFTVDTAGKFVFSQNRNVIMIVLDSFQTDVFNEIIHENPALIRDLDGFTYFRNSLGGYPATELSVALMLTGRFYENSLPFEQWKREAYLGGSLPRVLKSAGWQVDIYPDVSYSLYYSSEIASNFIAGVPFSEKMLAIAQIYDLALFRSLPHFLKPWVYNDQAWLLKGWWLESQRKRVLEIHSTRVTSPAVRRRLRNRLLFSPKAYRRSAAIRFVDRLLSESVATDTKGAFKFYHLMIPHIPLILDESFSYRVMAENRANYKRYATAAAKLMAIVVDHLKEIGIYDQSVVVILGDHGAGHQRQGVELRAGLPTRAGSRVVTDANRVSALPLLLLKGPGSRGDLQVSDAPVSMGDLAATVFSLLGLPALAPGTPMPAIDPQAERPRRFLVYNGRDIFSYYGDMVEYLVTGYGWLDESWRVSGRVFTRNGVVILNK